MLDLSESVILVGQGSTRVSETVKALKHCQSMVRFYSTLFLTDSDIAEPSITHVKIDNIPTIGHYQYFVVKQLPNIILNSIPADFNGYFLFINWDGFIVNPNAWESAFFEYDYIGAPWPWLNHSVGNGGFCLKSRKFLTNQIEICKDYSLIENEDIELSITLRNQFEARGCRYASSRIGYKFSTEYGNYDENQSFGFHDFRCNPQFNNIIVY
jgi:hypothetical protein